MLTKALSVALAALALAACGEAEPAHHAVGRNLADLEVTTLEAQPVRLGALGEGRPFVVNVWATWCPPCVRELPTLSDLAMSGDYTVIAISIDRRHDAIEKFLSVATLPGLTVLHDPNGSKVRAALGNASLPVTYIASPNGTIKAVEIGERDWAHRSMVAKIDKALNQ